MKHVRTITLSALAALAAGTAPAFAHVGVPGHVHGGFLAGLTHPVSGFDHLLAMLAVGIWSAIAAKGDTSKIWIAPVAFVTAMLVGAGAGIGGLPLPLVETGIALSVVALGLMIAARVELPALAGAALIALFAVYHGHAHGSEASGAVAAYMAGFALTTASLHIAGIGLGSAILRLRLAAPVVGGLIAAAGAYLFAA
jgi:urease accessory protein